MDDRIFPGLESFEIRAKNTVREYLGVKTFATQDGQYSRRSDFLTYRNTSWFIIKKNNPYITISALAKIFDKNHATVIHARKKYLHLYQGGSLFYSFIFLDIQCKMTHRKSIGINGLIEEMISCVSANDHTKDEARRFFLKRISLFKKKDNPVIASIIAFFMRSQVSGREVHCHLNSDMKCRGINYPPFKDVKTHINEIEWMVMKKIDFLKTQLKDENRTIIN